MANSGKPPLPDDLLEHARELRRNQTDAETILWRLLRNRQFLGLKFRRQHTVGPYILDFYCAERHFAIELDGSQHYEPDARAKDEQRTAYLASHGIEVLRFWNHEVLREMEPVLEVIYHRLSREIREDG